LGAPGLLRALLWEVKVAELHRALPRVVAVELLRDLLPGAKVIGLRQVLLQAGSRAVELSTMGPTQHLLTKTQQALITPRPATRRTLFASKGLLSFSRTSLSTKHQARQARATPATSMAAMQAFSPWARPT